MNEFNTSLLRERFVIKDEQSSSRGAPVIALSNRMVVELKNKNGKIQETFIVRAHNMHSCVRMTAKIIQSFITLGPLLNRAKPYDWNELWDMVVNDYERAYNPQRWIAIYNEGKPIFESGDNIHPFLALIERCDHSQVSDYEYALPLAKATFKKTGKTVNINYDGNVALVVNFGADIVRCGIILRGPDRTTTFNFSAHAKESKALNLSQCLNGASWFLEGIQLAFMVGMNETKLRLGLIQRHSREEKQTREARKRLARLSIDISNLEATHDVNYRPERPEFKRVMGEAEEIAEKLFSPEDDSGLVS